MGVITLFSWLKLMDYRDRWLFDNRTISAVIYNNFLYIHTVTVNDSVAKAGGPNQRYL